MAVSPTLTSHVQVNEDVLFQALHGEGVLLNLKTGVYFGLDPVGTRVWQLLQTHRLPSDILESMLKEYDVPKERCVQDLLALLADLERNGLVVLT